MLWRPTHEERVHDEDKYLSTADTWVWKSAQHSASMASYSRSWPAGSYTSTRSYENVMSMTQIRLRIELNTL